MAPIRRSEPDPRRAARRELARAFAELAGNAVALAGSVYTRAEEARATAQDLAGFAPTIEEPAPPPLPERPLRILLSCAEASGSIHAANLARELRALAARAGAPAPEIFGFGDERVAAAGVETHADPASRAAMLGSGLTASLPYYVDLLTRAGELARDRRPDVFVPVDSPALHVPMARIARRYGPRVVHFIAPQLWAWAPWRAARYRAAVDLGLTILPFEPAWFARHGIATAHVGHPLLDELAQLPPPPPEERRALVLLPGSRASEIRLHLPWMLAVLADVRAARPELDVVVAQATHEHTELVRSLVPDTAGVRVSIGDLHAVLAGARAALAVSGTVLTDLLHHRIPAVVLYRMRSTRKARLVQSLLTTPWFASTNLVAGAEVLPEFGFGGDGPRAEVGRALMRCYNDETWRAACLAGLERAARRLGPPGAARRAAVHILREALPRP